LFEELHSQDGSLQRDVKGCPSSGMGGIPPTLCLLSEVIGLLRGDVGNTRQDTGQGGAVVGHPIRNQLMADSIPGNGQISVRSVLAMLNALLAGKGFQRSPIEAEERPEQGNPPVCRRWRLFLHPGQTFGPGSAKQSQEDELRLILCMMGQDHFHGT
jgi:hypothetical protein